MLQKRTRLRFSVVQETVITQVVHRVSKKNTDNVIFCNIDPTSYIVDDTDLGICCYTIWIWN